MRTDLKGGVRVFQNHVTTSRMFNYAEAVKHVKNSERVFITGDDGREEAVLIGVKEWEKLKELLWERYVDEKLAEAEEDAKRPDAKYYTHDEIFGPLREKYGYDV